MKLSKPFSSLVPGWLLRAVVPLLFMLSAAAARAWVYETPYEFIVEADLDGDGRPDVVIVDKVSGSFRVGYQTTAGAPVWADARASGIDSVTGVSFGRVLSTTRDTLVFASPLANRVNILEVTNGAAPALPIALFIPSLGPNMAAAIDIGGAGNNANADLYIASRENPGPRETLVRNTGTTRTVLNDSALGQNRSSPNVFQHKSTATAGLGLFNRLPSPGNDQFLSLDLSTGVENTNFSLVVPIPNTPRVPEFVSARFASTSLLAQVLFYQPGASSLLKYQVQEPSPSVFNVGASNSFSLGQPIQLVEVLATTGNPRLLVLFGATPTNATVATVYDFDGVNPPVAVYSVTNQNGFTGAGALGGGHFSLLTGDGAGHSAGFQNLLASGSSYVPGSSGALPKTSPYAGGANVLLFAGEPFVLSTAKALKTLRAGDWSSQPLLTGGPPSTVVVSAERFLNTSNGLGSPSVAILGAAPAGTTHALVNQYVNPISVFPRRSALGDNPAEVSITPPAGLYNQAIKIAMTVNTAGWTIQYRLAQNAPWLTYTGPVLLFSNALVQYFARDSTITKTPIQSAAYRFSVPANLIDSDHDGVPDFVEVARGLDPLAGPDSDHDGYSDLWELLRGTDPLSNASVPSNLPPVDFKQVFDMLTTPRSLDGSGVSRLTLAATGTLVRTFGLDGKSFVQATSSNQPIAGITNPAANLVNIQPTASDVLVALTSDQHFDLNVAGDPRIGRELVGLVPVPPLTLPPIPDGSIAAGANAWIAAAANFVTNLPRVRLTNDLTYRDTLASVLFETAIAQILLARGTNDGTNLTIFPFRTADSGRAKATTPELLTVELYNGPTLPAYRLTNALRYLRDSLDTNTSSGVSQLVATVAAIYELSAAYNNTNPGALKLPFDELRLFLRNGALDSGYGAFYSGAIDFVAARAAASNLMATLQPRPTTNVLIEVVNSGYGIPTTFKIAGSATPVTLWRYGNLPCDLPSAFDVLPGSQLSLFGFTDISPGGIGMPVEVIALSFASIPIATDADANGDLLIDSWENLFLGGGTHDPFGDDDGDGYSNIQEMLAGTDPKNASSFPGGPPAKFSAPDLGLSQSGQSSLTSLTFQWPAMFVNNFVFGVRASATVDSGFVDLPVGLPVNLGGDTFSINFTPPPSQAQFFFLTVMLKQ